MLKTLYRQFQEPGDEQGEGIGEEQPEPAEKVGVSAALHITE